MPTGVLSLLVKDIVACFCTQMALNRNICNNLLDEKMDGMLPRRRREIRRCWITWSFPSREYWFEGVSSLEHIDCTDTIVKPEIIYYPAHWWHQTLNLDTPTISMAGRRIDALNYDEVARGLKKKCSSEQMDVEKRWPGAAPILKERVCANIERCHEIWDLLWDTPTTFFEAAKSLRL